MLFKGLQPAVILDEIDLSFNTGVMSSAQSNGPQAILKLMSHTKVLKLDGTPIDDRFIQNLIIELADK